MIRETLFRIYYSFTKNYLNSRCVDPPIQGRQGLIGFGVSRMLLQANSQVDFDNASVWEVDKPSIFEIPVTFNCQQQQHLLTIQESLGGQTQTNSVQIYLMAEATIEVVTRGAIASLSNAHGHQILAPQSSLSARLKAGLYYLEFSSDAAIASLFESELSVRYF